MYYVTFAKSVGHIAVKIHLALPLVSISTDIPPWPPWSNPYSLHFQRHQTMQYPFHIQYRFVLCPLQHQLPYAKVASFVNGHSSTWALDTLISAYKYTWKQGQLYCQLLLAIHYYILRWISRSRLFNREFKIYDADVDENVTSKYNVALS